MCGKNQGRDVPGEGGSFGGHRLPALGKENVRLVIIILEMPTCFGGQREC